MYSCTCEQFCLARNSSLADFEFFGYRCHRNIDFLQSPTYVQELITRTLRSSSTLRLNPVNFNLKTYGSRAFSVSAPELWEKLSNDIHLCANPSPFKRKLKTIFLKIIILARNDFFFILSLSSIFIYCRTSF